MQIAIQHIQSPNPILTQRNELRKKHLAAKEASAIVASTEQHAETRSTRHRSRHLRKQPVRLRTLWILFDYFLEFVDRHLRLHSVFLSERFSDNKK